MDNRELWVAATLVELADIRETDFDEAAHSRLLAARLAELLAPAETAVLLADSASRLRVVAASTEGAYRLMSLEASRGPAAACYRSGRPGPGGSGVWFLPMRRHDETVGVAGVLADLDTLDASAASLAQILAEAAAVAVLQQRELRRSARAAEQLQHALDSRVLVEQAKGAVAARLGITPNAAFGLLRDFARRRSRPLTEVAAGTIRGELPAAELVTTSQDRRGKASPAQAG